jgi:hypothetical protein
VQRAEVLNKSILEDKHKYKKLGYKILMTKMEHCGVFLSIKSFEELRRQVIRNNMKNKKTPDILKNISTFYMRRRDFDEAH